MNKTDFCQLSSGARCQKGGGGGELFHTFNSCNKNKRLDPWLSAPGEVYISKIASHAHNEADWKQC